MDRVNDIHKVTTEVIITKSTFVAVEWSALFPSATLLPCYVVHFVGNRYYTLWIGIRFPFVLPRKAFC